VHAVRRSKLSRFLALFGAAGMIFTYEALVPTSAGAAVVDETVTVPATSASGVNTATSLDPTKTYLLTVSGTYVYNSANPTGNAVADAECSILPPDTNYQRSRYLLLDPTGDALDLYVNGKAVEWEPSTPDAYGCNSFDHVYRFLFKPSAAGPANLRVYDPGVGSLGNNDNLGSLSVRVTEEHVIETVVVPSTSAGGVLTTSSLDPSRTYRFEARGTYTYGTPLSAADAQCVGLDGLPGWVPNLYGKVLAPNDPSAHPLGLYVNYSPQTWVPVTPSLLGCDDTSHAYSLIHKPQYFGKVRFSINDSNQADNSGVLTVRIIDVGTGPAAPGEQAMPKIELADTVNVPSTTPDGASTVVPVVAGLSYLIEATGTFAFGQGNADAECSTQTGVDDVYRRERFLSLGANMLDLFVDGHAVEWQATTADAQNCNTSNHTYRDEIVPGTTGKLTFMINDVYYGDNSGILTVKVYRIREIPLGSVVIDSANAAGASSIPLPGGQTYRFASSGTYTYWVNHPGTDADSECSQAAVPPYNDPTYQPNRFGPEGPNDLLDLFVNNSNVTWKPRTQAPAIACDTNHQYDLKYQPNNTGSVNFRVYDQSANYGDNSGSLTVNLFLQSG
jgi:hypothetical protein